MAVDSFNPVGEITELKGTGEVVRADGSVESLSPGLEIYNGDTVNTNDGGSVNITFEDGSSFAVSEDSSLVIDNFVYAPSTDAGVSDFSMLKGMFVYTSGLIGREDPDDVHIKTPVGSIGIRGTIIAGDVDSGSVTVVEGAIVLKDLKGGEVTLANQFETARFGDAGQDITYIGQISASEVTDMYGAGGIIDVAPELFSSVNDAGREGEAPAPAGEEYNVEGVVPVQEGDQIPQGQDELQPQGEDQNVPADAPVILMDGTNQILPPPPMQWQPLLDSGYEVIRDSNGNVVGMTMTPVTQPLSEGGMVDPAVLLAQQNQMLYGANPTFTGTLPEAFYRTAGGMAGSDWQYSFSKDFHDPNVTDQLTYKFALDNTTKNTLIQLGLWDATLQKPVAGAIDLNDGSVAFNLSSITSDSNLSFTVLAKDNIGNVTGHTYTLDVAVQDGSNEFVFSPGGGSYTLAQNGWDVFGGTGNDTLNMNANNGTAFMEGGSDTVNINGADNVVYLDGGANTATFGSGAEHNTAFGGGNADTFYFQNIKNQAYGTDGNDIFQVDVGALSSLQGAGTGNFFRIDGGADSEQAMLSDPTKMDDALKLMGSGSINFTNIANLYIKNIETIDLANTYSNTVTLNMQDVIAMTDSDNFLKINADTGGDSVNFDTMGQGYDHTVDGDYDVLSLDNGVTLYVQHSADLMVNGVVIP